MSDLKAVRVVLADDHPIWRSGVRNDLGSNFHVVGEARTAIIFSTVWRLSIMKPPPQ